jgi:hypothetical protein
MGYIEKDEAIFLFDCLRWGGLPECFGKYGGRGDSCEIKRWVKNYRLCRICEKVFEELNKGG